MGELVSFGEAIKALESGKRVARVGWGSKNMFIFKQVPAEIDMSIVPNMQSLPDTVKEEFNRRYNQADYKKSDVDPIKYNSIRYRNQLAMVYPDNTIYGWVASPSDALTEDWVILDK